MQRNEAFVVDFDDVVFQRESITRIMGAVRGKLHPTLRADNMDDYSVTVLPMTREVETESLKEIPDRVSLYFHSTRPLVPGIKNVLEAKRAQDVDIFGNTGRANSSAWVTMTETALLQNGIADYFQQIYFTPRHVSTALSKAAAISELSLNYEQITHVDDDPRTIYYLASVFRDTRFQFYLLQYGSTGLLYSREDFERFKNVTPIGVIAKVLEKKP